MKYQTSDQTIASRPTKSKKKIQLVAMMIIGVNRALMTIPKYIELIARPLKKVCSFLSQCFPQIIVSAGNIQPWKRPCSSRNPQRIYILQSADCLTPKFNKPGINNDKNISNLLWIHNVFNRYILSHYLKFKFWTIQSNNCKLFPWHCMNSSFLRWEKVKNWIYKNWSNKITIIVWS